MTCLVAWRGKDGTWVGADSSWTQGSQIGSSKEKKFWRNGRWVILLAGSMRVSQIIQQCEPFESTVPNDKIIGHLVRDWLPKVARVLKRAGQSSTEEKTITFGVEGLIVSRTKILRLGGEFSVTDDPLHYACGGNGEEVALGYLVGQQKQGDGRQIVHGALRASSFHNNTVRGPFSVERV